MLAFSGIYNSIPLDIGWPLNYFDDLSSVFSIEKLLQDGNGNSIHVHKPSSLRVLGT